MQQIKIRDPGQKRWGKNFWKNDSRYYQDEKIQKQIKKNTQRLHEQEAPLREHLPMVGRFFKKSQGTSCKTWR